MKKGVNHIDTGIIGRRYGMLVVQTETDPVKDARGHTIRRFICRCDCGNEKVFRYNNLMSNRSNSCGCTRFPKKPPADLRGQKFRMLTVVSEAEPYVEPCGKNMRRWNCVCECGNTVTVLHTNLISPNGTKSCGCIVGRTCGRTSNPPNLTGNRYGKLVVLSPADPIIRANRSRRRAWLCHCDCGRDVIKAEDNLLSGHTRSCGCLRGHGFHGRKFGMLTARSRADNGGSMRYWNCLCECGNEIIVSQDDLYWGSVTSCGCVQQGKPRMDLTGQTFGKLTALREVAPLPTLKGKPERAWLCRCECGREVVVRHHNLTNRVTRSCGCLRSERQSQRHKREEVQP